MKSLTVLAGPNGAGKSTCTNFFIEQNILQVKPVNLDELKQLIDPSILPDDILRYQREENKQLEKLFEELYQQKIMTFEDFAYECNLREDQLKPVPYFEKNGYSLHLIFLCLDDVNQCEHRVEQRVKQGGHSVNKSSILENFNEGLHNLDESFLDWHSVLIIDNSKEMTAAIFIKAGKLEFKFSLPKCINKKNTPRLFDFLHKK
jgi:predicted ABC-type ATPase